MIQIIKKIISLPRLPLLAVIWIYQRTVSPDHGPLHRFFPNGFCRFHPSCSAYGHEAIKRHGLIKGGFYASYRIFRCNPFSKGGIDHVPPASRMIRTE